MLPRVNDSVGILSLGMFFGPLRMKMEAESRARVRLKLINAI